MLVREFIRNYVKGTLGKKTVCGCWSIINWGNMDVLQYTPSDDPDEHERIAYRLPDGSVLSNANRLVYVGRKFAWGREVNNNWINQVEEQRWLENYGAIPLPFTLFDEVPEMDVRVFEWIAKPVPETVRVLSESRYDPKHDPKTVERHFSGACIFAIGKSVYLFDIDRQEIEKHNIFNPFLTRLPERVEKVGEAYDILTPDEVKKALVEGIDVQRQGEFFFIKYSDECPVKPDLTDEEQRILKFPPSRIGYGFGEFRRVMWLSEDRDPLESEEVDTPEKQEFQKAALVYADILRKYRSVISQPGTLGKSATGSHSVEKYIKMGEDVYASGTIKQNRRQHGDLVLTGWYKVVANTGTLSWTISGDID